eukprot:8647827-Alexandrium_andersonii.AAC.1
MDAGESTASLARQAEPPVLMSPKFEPQPQAHSRAGSCWRACLKLHRQAMPCVANMLSLPAA